MTTTRTKTQKETPAKTKLSLLPPGRRLKTKAEKNKDTTSINPKDWPKLEGHNIFQPQGMTQWDTSMYVSVQLDILMLEYKSPSSLKSLKVVFLEDGDVFLYHFCFYQF